MSLLFDGCHGGQRIDAGGGGDIGPWRCLVINLVFPGNHFFRTQSFFFFFWRGSGKRDSPGASSIICQRVWLPSRPGDWDAGFDLRVFREQRKRRATVNQRKDGQRQALLPRKDAELGPLFHPHEHLSSSRKWAPGKLWQLVTLRCQQISVHSQDLPRSVQGWHFLGFPG